MYSDDDHLDFAKQGGLLPAIVQDANNQRILMLGYMDRAALAHTRASGLVTFFSRSKGRLWTKGEHSGHVLEVVSIEADCDQDSLLVQAVPRGPTCHLLRPSCFADAPGRFLGDLDELIRQREAERPAASYTTGLFAGGIQRIAQKVGEEGVETALAAVGGDPAALLAEAADLMFHLLVLLRARGLGLTQLDDLLRQRHSDAKAS